MNPSRRRWLAFSAAETLLLTTGAAALLPACSRKPPPAQAVPHGSTVLALGDSITFGTGATPQTAYPAVLAKLSGWNIINAGVPGDTSAQALQRLPPLLEEHAPKLVLVSIGGNDFLRRLPESETRNNIRGICELALAARAQVLLIAVPGLSLAAAVSRNLSDHALYEELATELKLPLMRDGWSEVLSRAELRSDNIHANAAGYARFAELAAKAARNSGLIQ